MTEPCAHSHIAIAAGVLRREGTIGGYEAVYDLVCPYDRTVRRNTRLASTIHTLRHQYEWVITSEDRPGKLVEYHLVTPSAYPAPLDGDPVQRARITVDDVPVGEAWQCVEVIDKVDSKNAIATRVKCGKVVTEKPMTAMLGGWQQGYCPGCGRKDATFIPITIRPA